MAWSVPWNLLAMYLSGDLGGYTVYSDRYGRPTWFPKDTPSRPPSQEQIILRQRFAAAQANWKAADAETRANYEAATKKLSMPLTGQNLWISVSMRHDTSGLETVSAQSGLALPTPPFV